VTAVTNTRADIDGGGGGRSEKVVAVVNSLEKEKPRPSQSTTFLSIEGS
jgi:hypothetical protein